MANEEHFARLRQGVDARNQWREAHRDIKPDLAGADLRKADLREANFVWADLCGADFVRANLTQEVLAGADVSEASIAWTTFADVDLSTVRGLETAHHEGPSTIGIDTLYRSHGNIPEVFLRGAGVLEDFIPDEFSAIGNVSSPPSPLLHSIPHKTNTSNVNGLTLKVHAEAPQGSPTGGGLNRD